MALGGVDRGGRIVDQPEVPVGVIGCGPHAFRNIYPALQFLPVRLQAVCDLDAERAEVFARRFGAAACYGDYHQMLQREQLQAVLVITGYDDDGRPTYPPIAADCLRAGCDVWIEKPPAASSDELVALQGVAQQTGRFVAVGFKKMFFPANEKLKAITQSASFGRLHCVHVKYPQFVPDQAGMADLKGNARLRGFLDHLCHPASLLVYLAGPAESLLYQRSQQGAAAVLVRFGGGAIGSLLLSAGQPRTAPLERTEVIGEGESAVAENNVRVWHYRKGDNLQSGYGRTTDYFGEVVEPVHYWEPEFSLGQLYNKGLFLLGYYGELAEFVRAVQERRRVCKGHLDDAVHITRWFEAMCRGPGTWQRIG